ncbi:hypothetical protein ABL78_1727 [Leptomonas seymouri]|uniref:Uncharacterized protein n=1 Tax=Leptomonas seymouri TaxID=5684 RepID=A0A0N1PDI2_LEPSE|nr:hypothetical protein ABL78_1727 [Leptomonas seymouri]|eukprot:KPI89164.1 hypothetical protein ABL78_1727 [Leptomonas seymouri]
MSVIVTKQRYNWMGYNGTETEEIDTSLLRNDGTQADNYNYDHRQQVIAELKERLYQIKRDLELLPEEELRAEEELRQRRRAERKRRAEEARRRRAEEEAARAEEEERQRIEQEERLRQQEEEEQRRREQEAEAQRNAQRWRQLHDDSDADSDIDEEEKNEILSKMRRTQAEIDHATAGFAMGTRMLLAVNGQGYVSYIDGSLHASIDQLEAHNQKARAAAEAITAGSSVRVPPAAEYSLDDVRASAEKYQLLRKKLDAYRALQDPTYSARIRASEKGRNGQPSTAITHEDGDEATIKTHMGDAKRHSEELRKAYNAKAAASGAAIAGVMCSRSNVVLDPVPEAPMEEEAVPAAAVEQAAEAAAAEEVAQAAAAEEVAAEVVAAQQSDRVPTPAAGSSKHSSKKSTPKANNDEL